MDSKPSRPNLAKYLNRNQSHKMTGNMSTKRPWQSQNEDSMNFRNGRPIHQKQRFQPQFEQQQQQQQQQQLLPSSGTGKNSGPVETTLRRTVAPPLWKKVKQEQKYTGRIVRDPRFDDLSGKLDIAAWSKNYQFLEDIKKKERSQLQKELRGTDDMDERKRVKLAIQRIDNQTREKKKITSQKLAKSVDRKAAIEALNQGRRPYMKKNSEMKLEVLAKQFDTLKKEKRLDKYLERKEKKIKAKELFGK